MTEDGNERKEGADGMKNRNRKQKKKVGECWKEGNEVKNKINKKRQKKERTIRIRKKKESIKTHFFLFRHSQFSGKPRRRKRWRKENISPGHENNEVTLQGTKKKVKMVDFCWCLKRLYQCFSMSPVNVECICNFTHKLYFCGSKAERVCDIVSILL